MKSRIVITLAIVCLLNSCISVPKETVQLSRVIGTDLTVLQNSHTTMVELFYTEIINNINAFIEEVYAPFIINYVLKGELKNYKNNVSPSIFGVINKAASDGTGKSETAKVLIEMSDFLKAANANREKKKRIIRSNTKTKRYYAAQYKYLIRKYEACKFLSYKLFTICLEFERKSERNIIYCRA